MTLTPPAKTSRSVYSQYRGVSWQLGANQWVAQFKVYGQVVHIGKFKTELEAAKAYDFHARPYGKKLNFGPQHQAVLGPDASPGLGS